MHRPWVPACAGTTVCRFSRRGHLVCWRWRVKGPYVEMFGESVSRITSPSSKVWDASLIEITDQAKLLKRNLDIEQLSILTVRIIRSLNPMMKWNMQRMASP